MNVYCLFIVYYLCNVVSVTFGAGGKANLKAELVFCLYLLVRLKGHNRILTYHYFISLAWNYHDWMMPSVYFVLKYHRKVKL